MWGTCWEEPISFRKAFADSPQTRLKGLWDFVATDSLAYNSSSMTSLKVGLCLSGSGLYPPGLYPLGCTPWFRDSLKGTSRTTLVDILAILGPDEPYSKLQAGSYIGNYIGQYYRAYKGGYEECRL